MNALLRKTVRVWREKHHLTRAGAVLILLCLMVRGFLEPAFTNALSDPARPTAAQVSHVLGIFAALVSVLTLQVVGFVLVGIGTWIEIRERKRAIRRTPWWRDR